MKLSIFVKFLCVLCTLVFGYTQPSNGYDIKKNIKQNRIDCCVSYLPDSNSAIKNNGVLGYLNKFVAANGVVPNLTLGCKACWVRIVINNPHAQAQVCVLQIDNKNTDSLLLYEQIGEKELKLIGTRGLVYLNSNTEQPYRNLYAYKLRFEKGDKKTYFLRGSNKYDSFRLPLVLWSELGFVHRTIDNTIFWGFFFGMMTFIIIVSTASYFAVNKIVFLHFSIYATFIMIFELHNGSSFLELIGIKQVYWEQYIQRFLLPGGAFVGLILIMNTFFDAKEKFRRSYRASTVIGFLAIMLSIIGLAITDNSFLLSINRNLFYIIVGIGVVILLRMSILGLMNNANYSNYLITSLAPFVLVVFYIVMRNIGLIPHQQLFEYPVTTAFSVQIALLFSVLMMQLYDINQEKLNLEIEKVRNTTDRSKLVIEIEDAERAHIARELHDDVGQQLSAMKMMWQVFKKKINTPGYVLNENQAQIEQINKIITDVNISVRSFSHQLSVLNFEQKGLEQSIDDLLKTMSEIGIRSFIYELDYDIPSKIEAALSKNIYRVIQELINNVIKHTEATSVHIACVQIDDATIRIKVADNGTGECPTEAQIKNGIGLKNIAERSNLYGGKFEFISNKPNKGCTAQATFIIDHNTYKKPTYP